MTNFDDLEKPEKTNLLISFCDIQGFRPIAQKLDPIELFGLMNGMAVTIIRSIKKTAGRVIKFIGDEALIVFPGESADAGMRHLLDLKSEVEEYFRTSGADMKLKFGVHCGEAVIGPFGEEPFKTIDISGDNVNIAAKLVYGDHRGKFVVTPQAFRALEAETRKRFHKFTLPIVYLAE